MGKAYGISPGWGFVLVISRAGSARNIPGASGPEMLRLIEGLRHETGDFRGMDAWKCVAIATQSAYIGTKE
jgi:hypothetical protein